MISPAFNRPIPFAFALAIALSLSAVAAPSPAPPPGYNVHLVQETKSGRLWRGGAPRKDTLEALAASAKKRHVTVTLLDLRTPANADDKSGKAGRLSPAQEKALCIKLGLRYEPISALGAKLTDQISQALTTGDAYLHCMYGVNRTGYATARYACAAQVHVDTAGLGKHDWEQGYAHQRRIKH